VFFSATSIAWLWPLPTAMGTHVARAPYWWDAQLTTYLLGEARHNLLGVFSKPQDLFETRIMHPQRDGLALSENLLAPALLTLPFEKLASPLVLNNLLIIFGVAANGIAAFAYLRRRTRNRLAALVGALLFAYAPIHLMMLARVQLTLAFLLPLMLLLLERVLARPTAARLAALSACWLAQLTTCIYFAVQFAVLAGPVALVFVLKRWRLGWRKLLPLAAVLLATVALSAALTAPYAHVSVDLGMRRDAAFVTATSGTWKDLANTSTLSALWGRRATPVDEGSAREPVAFPGVMLLALAAAGLLFALLRLVLLRRGQTAPALDGEPILFGPWLHALWVGLALLMFLGTGPDSPPAAVSPFGWLHTLPGLQGMRYSNRFAFFGTLALAALATFALDELLEQARARRPALAHGAGAVLVLAGLGETWTVPIPLQPVPASEPIYRALRADPGAHAIAEIPFDGRPHPPRLQRDLGVLVHGLPTLSGFTGFDPPVWQYVQDQLARFPDENSHALLVALGVDRVVVHEHDLGGVGPDLSRIPWLHATARDETHAIYAVDGTDPARAGELRRPVHTPVLREPPATVVPREALRVSAAPGMPADTAALLDGDSQTRWTTRRLRRPGPWLRVDLDKPRAVSALWLDLRAIPFDGPTSLRIEGTLEDGRAVVLLAEPPHAAIERLRTAPATALTAFRFPPTRLRSLTISEQGSSNRYWGSVYELWLEAADKAAAAGAP
jgi:hypothetical protein